MRPNRFALGAASGRAESLDDCAEDRMRAHPNCHCFQAGSDDIRNNLAARQHERQRPGPKLARERLAPACRRLTESSLGDPAIHDPVSERSADRNADVLSLRRSSGPRRRSTRRPRGRKLSPSAARRSRRVADVRPRASTAVSSSSGVAVARTCVFTSSRARAVRSAPLSHSRSLRRRSRRTP